VEGVPANPPAWLLTVARRRQIDAARRRQTRAGSADHLQLIADEMEEAAATSTEIPDRRLALMFACAHPAIERNARSPLILQTVLGFTAADIASAFLIPPAAMSQRLVRAKARIKEAGIPFRVPDADELPDRLDTVLEAIYAAYSKGWGEIGEGGGESLAGEAIWLAQLVVALLPAEPEAKAMLALMLYAEARRAARRSPAGAYIPLDEQDTGAWDGAHIARAEDLLRQATAIGSSGRYQIEAAIQSAHVARRLVGVDTAAAILALYDHLLALTASPVVALNRAVALAEVEGPAAGLAALMPLGEDKRLVDYQPYWAARGHLAARAGDRADAHSSLTLALGLSADPAVRAYLREELDKLTG
jgi:RNA polymerase sigma-70 factor (ECF subfamily)